MMDKARTEYYVVLAKEARERAKTMDARYWLQMARGVVGDIHITQQDRDAISIALWRVGNGEDPRKVFRSKVSKRGVTLRADWVVIAQFAEEYIATGGTKSAAKVEAGHVFGLEARAVERYLREWRKHMAVFEEVRNEQIRDWQDRGLIGSDGFVRDELQMTH